MAIKSYADLNEMHISVLCEIGNIGCGNAATALSEILAQGVQMSTPEVGIVNYAEAYDKLGGAETVKAGLVLLLSGDISGLLMFLLDNEAACTIVNKLVGSNFAAFSEIDEIGFSAISEIANIMSGSFVRAITGMTGLFIDISPPSSCVDMLSSMLSMPFTYFAEVGDLFMYIKNEFEISGQKADADVLLLPDMESLEKIMAALGLG